LVRAPKLLLHTEMREGKATMPGRRKAKKKGEGTVRGKPGADAVGAGMRALEARLRSAVKQSGLLAPGERVGVAVSGGADSVALLRLLVEMRAELAIVPSVVHLNHGMRGRAADADAKFVAELAAKLKLEFFGGAADVPARARREKLNIEDAARRARQEFFAETAERQRLDKVAVAHTADDQAETVLAHLLRGSGLAGLAGIHPRAGKIVRPLLGVRREELRAYLKARKQAWREDATNRDTTKTRARIRKKLIPLLKKEYQPRVVEHLAALATHARHDDALLEEIAKGKLESCATTSPVGPQIPVAALVSGTDEDAAAGMGSRLVRLVVERMKRENGILSGGELTALHVEKVLELAGTGKSGATLTLPSGVEVRRVHDALEFCASEKGGTEAREYAYEIAADGGEKRVAVPELGCAFRFTAIDWVDERGDTSKTGDVLDRERLKFPLTLRNWRHGDRFRARGHASPHKLKRIFNARRIDRWRRNGWPVLASDGTVVWCKEFGAAADVAASASTKTGFRIAEEKL
jgi:tRNA(Ile)-lysidine synthase